ncbi:hypothetical protein [Filimonas effusa]|uniref:CCDC81-like prokaryotic HU domain-containing protein n=1 Tax=Filimonas effusa TaxID=2508721 RepID=A0A4V1MAH4_9BACT|nr:hypothetical protein [Filimonas effusa]RXK85886.1 hypothetical protein ESB13_03490 [Filimonas effusa]
MLKTSDVNKYDAFIHDFLVQHQQVTLEKIGTLQVTGDQKLPEHGTNAAPVVQFSFDRKAETDPLLLDFIAERSVKNRALVAADLSSYLEQVRQFINIGKPYVIPGIGAVFMAKSMGYEFSQQSGASFVASPMVPVSTTEHYIEADPAESGRIRKKNSLAGLAFVVLVLVIGGVAWAIYNRVKDDKGSNSVQSEQQAPPPGEQQPDTTATAVAASADTQAPGTATTAAPATQAAAGGMRSYKFVFETTASGDRARTRTAQLQSFGDPAFYDSTKLSDNSYQYRLYLKHNMNIGDSTRVKDSLRMYLDRNVTLAQD